MREEINSLVRKAIYVGVGAILVLLVSMIGDAFKLSYMADPAGYLVMVAVCFALPPLTWPLLHQFFYIACNWAEEVVQEEQEEDDYEQLLNGHSTFQSKELEELKKKYDSPKSKKSDDFYGMII